MKGLRNAFNRGQESWLPLMGNVVILGKRGGFILEQSRFGVFRDARLGFGDNLNLDNSRISFAQIAITGENRARLKDP